jgi:hypothetical protein
MVAEGYTNLSVSVEARDAVRLLTVEISAALGRRVSQSDALRIATDVTLRQVGRSRIRVAARDLDII